ncbi:MAG TPA: hypothetical protein VGC41_22555 [Kofleriaceae bacterium]
MRLGLETEVWDIVQDGAKLVITTGGKQTTRKFISPDHAAIQMKKLIAEKVTAGWTETDAAITLAPTEPQEPALEQEVLAALDDPGPYSVYGDWYQHQNHPRGELIALQQADEDHDSAKFKGAINTIFVRHKSVLLGPLAELGGDSFEWRNGFIYGITLEGHTAGALVRAVAAHPSGRFLGAVRTDPEGSSIDAERTTSEVFAALQPVARTLREIVIEQGPDMPALDVITEMPNLRELELATVEGFRSVAPITKVSAKLSRLALRGALDWIELAPLFEREDLRLRELAYCAPQLPQMLHALAESPLATHLESLRIPYQPSGDVSYLVAHRERFPKLRQITATLEMLTIEARNGLKSMARLVDAPLYEDDFAQRLGYDEDHFDNVQE